MVDRFLGKMLRKTEPVVGSPFEPKVVIAFGFAG
jgi:hypothetical protein